MTSFGRKSITFRLTLLFASVSTTVLLLLGLIVGALAERHFEELDMELLTGKLELIQHALARVRSQNELDALPSQLRDALVGHHGLGVAVLTADGRSLFATDGPEFPATLLDRSSPTPDTRPVVWLDQDNHSYRGVSARGQTGIAGAPPLLIVLSTDLSHHERFMRSFRLTLWAVVGAAALLTGILGWFAAHRGLSPLREMRNKAAEITANRLDYRLSVASIPVELAQVAETLNDMLARLEESFKRLSEFSSDLAHELRTPVSNLLTQTQVTLSKARTPDEYREVLVSNVEEFERLSRMIGDMLFLAKSDNALIVPSLEKIDLRREVESAFEFYDALAEEKNIRLTLSGSGFVAGDRSMLRRVIHNLLSNAIRHASQGGCVEVQITESGDSRTTLSVNNTGETIAPEHLPRLFDRFYRADPSRQRFAEGTGLGLAITRSIVLAHRGEVAVSSADGVTRFDVRIPTQLRVS